MSIFFRVETDGTTMPVNLEDFFAGTTPSACWLIGGGPSLTDLPLTEMAASPWPICAINRAGEGLVRPHIWTAYDPSDRFPAAIYRDARVLKVIPRRRAGDLIPGTRWKVGDGPATVCFERDGGRGFADLLSLSAPGIVDWSDSFVQAIDVLYRLGFRRVYLAGCELRIGITAEQRSWAADRGVSIRDSDGLADLMTACRDAGVDSSPLAQCPTAAQYHFGLMKPFPAAVQTDRHYQRIADCLRLSRRCLARVGMELVSVTPDSRLNADFPYVPVGDVLSQLRADAITAATEMSVRLPDVRPPRTNSAVNRPAVTVEREGWEPAACELRRDIAQGRNPLPDGRGSDDLKSVAGLAVSPCQAAWRYGVATGGDSPRASASAKPCSRSSSACTSASLASRAERGRS